MTIPSWKLLAQLDHLHDMQARLNSEATKAKKKAENGSNTHERNPEEQVPLEDPAWV